MTHKRPGRTSGPRRALGGIFRWPSRAGWTDLLLAAALCAAALMIVGAPALAQNVYAPDPIPTGNSQWVTTTGNEPNGLATLNIYYEGNIPYLDEEADPEEPDDQQHVWADSNGQAHFRPMVPEGVDIICFTNGVPESWEDLCLSLVIPAGDVLLQWMIFDVLRMILFSEAYDGTAYVASYVDSAEEFIVYRTSETGWTTAPLPE